MEDGTASVPGLEGIWPVIGEAVVKKDPMDGVEENQLRGARGGQTIYLTERPIEPPSQKDIAWAKFFPDDEGCGWILKK